MSACSPCQVLAAAARACSCFEAMMQLGAAVSSRTSLLLMLAVVRVPEAAELAAAEGVRRTPTCSPASKEQHTQTGDHSLEETGAGQHAVPRRQHGVCCCMLS